MLFFFSKACVQLANSKEDFRFHRTFLNHLADIAWIQLYNICIQHWNIAVVITYCYEVLSALLQR